MKERQKEYLLQEIVGKLLSEYPIELMYITGSHVNGYSREDSDIDIVATSSVGSRNTPIEFPANFSVHLISPMALRMYGSAQPYAHLKMVPLYNADACMEVSDSTKSEIVRRQLIRFKNKGKMTVDVLDPIKNHLLEYSCQRPWRTIPTKRMFASEETFRLMKPQYQRAFDIVEQKGMVEKVGRLYRINPEYVFDEEFREDSFDPIFAMKESVFGWHYLKNLGFIFSSMMKKY